MIFTLFITDFGYAITSQIFELVSGGVNSVGEAGRGITFAVVDVPFYNRNLLS